MALEIDDTHLGFLRPTHRQVTEWLKLTNNSQSVVAFNTLSLPSKEFFMHPTSGLIRPNSTIDIHVTLPVEEDEPRAYRCRHQFRVYFWDLEGSPVVDGSIFASWSWNKIMARGVMKEHRIHITFGTAHAMSNKTGKVEMEPYSYTAHLSPHQIRALAFVETSTVVEETGPAADATGAEASLAQAEGLTEAQKAERRDMKERISDVEIRRAANSRKIKQLRMRGIWLEKDRGSLQPWSPGAKLIEAGEEENRRELKELRTTEYQLEAEGRELERALFRWAAQIVQSRVSGNAE
ncbi:uncharacterized protein AB675_1396 [Cyphellophora attinorum]|uniref:MSP domain-containing protein n=1 Tax=Cyphellophora attinorum TaxID=1664694 RepID=A0A0N0NHE1_9EURO|nr:uncharacterized protein AB675_1396 [Phialophora attinorum]KPI34458.1 hypothetical protein AB675_1396 [Phialophora attinorum]